MTVAIKQIDKTLTEVELELMSILWQLGEGSVHDVKEALPQNRRLAYTSVSTILRILEQKKILQTRKEGRGHIYSPAFSKAAYETSTIKNVISKVFGGTPISLVKQLLDTTDLTPTDLAEIKKLLEERMK
jgi:predicted transcriptional regulator